MEVAVGGAVALGLGFAAQRVLSGRPALAPPVLATSHPTELATAPRVELRLVSNEAGLGVHPPTADGLRFRDLLGLVNQRVAAASSRVVLMVAGLPHMLKDTPPGSPFDAPSHEAP